RKPLPLDGIRDTVDRRTRIRKMLGPPHEKQRPSALPDIPWVDERLREKPAVGGIILGRVLLSHQDVSLFTSPAPTPRLVRPAQAERKIRGARLQDLVERSVQ